MYSNKDTSTTASKDFSSQDNIKSSTKRDVRNAADSVVSDLSEYAEKAGRSVRGFINSASTELSHASEKLTSEIRTNPVRSSLIALGAGLVLGALLRR